LIYETNGQIADIDFCCLTFMQFEIILPESRRKRPATNNPEATLTSDSYQAVYFDGRSQHVWQSRLATEGNWPLDINHFNTEKMLL
jgi:hypothetical protein